LYCRKKNVVFERLMREKIVVAKCEPIYFSGFLQGMMRHLPLFDEKQIYDQLPVCPPTCPPDACLPTTKCDVHVLMHHQIRLGRFTCLVEGPKFNGGIKRRLTKLPYVPSSTVI
jgi:hypothetical protein